MSSQDTADDSELEASLRATRQAYRRKSQGLSDTTNHDANIKDNEPNIPRLIEHMRHFSFDFELINAVA